jgi:predicted transglutaminase-like cysteine proteinase
MQNPEPLSCICDSYGNGKIKVALYCCLLFALAFMAVHLVTAAGNFSLDPVILDETEKKFGLEARMRLLSWQQLIRQEASRSELEKLEKVNTFFNKLNFIDDSIHWRKRDYWATPVEFLATNGGDCEDFSLAKYFTLKILGIAESKITLTYVKAWKLNQAHMVLTYYGTPEAEPLVLDNLINDIQPASQRTDLYPVYSFNGSGLWLAKARERGKLVGPSDRLGLWNDLLKRMPDSLR